RGQPVVSPTGRGQRAPGAAAWPPHPAPPTSLVVILLLALGEVALMVPLVLLLLALGEVPFLVPLVLLLLAFGEIALAVLLRVLGLLAGCEVALLVVLPRSLLSEGMPSRGCPG